MILAPMGVLMEFRRGEGNVSPRKDPPHEEKCSKNAPHEQKSPHLKNISSMWGGGGASAYCCPHPAGAHACSKIKSYVFSVETYQY